MSDLVSIPRPHADEDAEKAIFVIEPESSQGSGFLVEDNRHILTAYHVIEEAQQNIVKVRDVNNADTPKDYLASIQMTWKDHDIALLCLNEPIPGKPSLPLSSPRVLSHKTQIRMFGFPGLFGACWHNAEIAGGPRNGKYDIDFNVGYPDSLRGLSGGPVFLSGDDTYSIVGVITEHGPENLQKGEFESIDKALSNDITNIFMKEKEADLWCYVVLSEADVEKKQENGSFTLEQAVLAALGNNPQVKDGTKRLAFGIATDLVSSEPAYRDAIMKICQARIAIFDITRFEPAVMLLLGVRSVVRRGVTIVSTGDFIIGDEFDIPFNIKELTIISHSGKQYLETKTPPQIIRDKIEQGLIQLEKLPQYLDLPAFDAVRNLPPEYRTPDSSNVLILCPYSKKYRDNNWVSLERRLISSLSKNARILRILDLMSPRLVSSTIYEAIRRTDLCLVDWTEWRPNVFFEFGVRIALTGPKGFTICIIEDRHKHLIHEIKNPTMTDKDICNWIRVDSKNLKKVKVWYMQIAKQCKSLLTLFDPLVYNTLPFTQNSADQPLKGLFKFDQSAYDNIMYYYYNKDESSVASEQSYGRAPGFTYEVIELNIDVEEEPVSVPVYIDLLRTAKLFGVESDKSQTVVLYPKNRDLNRSVEVGITQRLLAAWYYLRQEHKDEEEIIKDENLFEDYQQIGLKLHDHIQDDRPELADEVADILEALRQKKGNHHEKRTGGSKTSKKIRQNGDR